MGSSSPRDVSTSQEIGTVGDRGGSGTLSPNLWRRYLAANAVLVAAFLFLHDHPAVQACIFLTVSVGELAAVFIGIRSNGLRRHRVWLLIAAGLVPYVSANIVWYGSPELLNRPLPFPSLSDFLYIPGYVLLLAGLVTLIREVRGRERSELLDAGMVAIVGGMVFWMLAIDPAITQSGLTPIGRAFTISYPLFDLALLAIVARMIVRRGSPAGGLLARLRVDPVRARIGSRLLDHGPQRDLPLRRLGRCRIPPPVRPHGDGSAAPFGIARHREPERAWAATPESPVHLVGGGAGTGPSPRPGRANRSGSVLHRRRWMDGVDGARRAPAQAADGRCRNLPPLAAEDRGDRTPIPDPRRARSRSRVHGRARRGWRVDLRRVRRSKSSSATHWRNGWRHPSPGSSHVLPTTSSARSKKRIRPADGHALGLSIGCSPATGKRLDPGRGRPGPRRARRTALLAGRHRRTSPR